MWIRRVAGYVAYDSQLAIWMCQALRADEWWDLLGQVDAIDEADPVLACIWQLSLLILTYRFQQSPDKDPVSARFLPCPTRVAISSMPEPSDNKTTDLENVV